MLIGVRHSLFNTTAAQGIPHEEGKENARGEEPEANSNGLRGDGGKEVLLRPLMALREQPLLVVGHEADCLLTVLNLEGRYLRLPVETVERFGEIVGTVREFLKIRQLGLVVGDKQLDMCDGCGQLICAGAGAIELVLISGKEIEVAAVFGALDEQGSTLQCAENFLRVLNPVRGGGEALGVAIDESAGNERD
jgi:hypothetical protein